MLPLYPNFSEVFVHWYSASSMHGRKSVIITVLHMQERRYIYTKQLLSIESYFSCMRTIIKEETVKHFDQNGFFTVNQHGFWFDYSCVM